MTLRRKRLTRDYLNMGKNNHKGFDSFISSILSTKKVPEHKDELPEPVKMQTDADLLKMMAPVLSEPKQEA